MYKIAVMGDYDSIYGFASVGLTTFPVEEETSTEVAARLLRQTAESGYGIIYMTEHLAARLDREVKKYASQLMPAIILIPGVQGNTGKGVEQVRKSVEQAVGSDILFGGEE